MTNDSSVQTNKAPPKLSGAKLHATIISMYAKNMGAQAIATACGVSRGCVQSVLRKFTPVFKELQNVGEYRNSKSDILSAAQFAALKSAFSGTKLAKAGFLSTVQAVEILNKMERLENNQSTEIVSKFGVNLNINHLMDGNNSLKEQDISKLRDAKVVETQDFS